MIKKDQLINDYISFLDKDDSMRTSRICQYTIDMALKIMKGIGNKCPIPLPHVLGSLIFTWYNKDNKIVLTLEIKEDKAIIDKRYLKLCYDCPFEFTDHYDNPCKHLKMIELIETLNNNEFYAKDI